MAGFWVTEAIPIPATALIPILLFPIFGLGTIQESAAPYAHPLIFLMLGGFMMAKAIEAWGIHERLALKALLFFGTRDSYVVAGFMITTAFLSMWLSNTAVVAMMAPNCYFDKPSCGKRFELFNLPAAWNRICGFGRWYRHLDRYTTKRTSCCILCSTIENRDHIFVLVKNRFAIFDLISPYRLVCAHL